MSESIISFIIGFSYVLTGNTLPLMLLGIAIGFVVGILPGLGGTTTLALMLPFITKMKAFEAFAFLLGMAAVTATTGDITSVIFGIPGEATTVATIADGHPMAKKGQAGRALGAVLMSSLVGALFGAIFLVLAVPIVRPLVITFGSPEFFMLTLLGITFVASLSGGVLLRGIISGGLGLLLSTVGLCAVSGIPRYTFGQFFLWDGIGLVTIAMGFFGIPEIIDLAVQRSSIAREQVGKLGSVVEGVKDTFRHWWLVIRCSAIGTLTGLIPGLGAATTQWLAYAYAVKISPNKERFGKGTVEGVLGPGAANNSSLGGNLTITLAFGVPAGVMMAILLGAFLIQGLTPGPDMLIPEAKGGHLALTYSFAWTIIISNIITTGICFIFLNQIVKITQIRGSLIIPLILVLINLGSFAEKNAFGDVFLMLLFGFLGWVMVRLNWPRPPLILGLVLGPLAENRFFLSVGNYGVAWLLRPGVLLISMLLIGIVFYPMVKARWRKEGKFKVEQSGVNTMKQNRAKLQRNNWAVLFSLFILVISILALYQSMDFGFRAGLFPRVVIYPVLVLIIVQFIRELMGKGGGSSMEDSLENVEPRLPDVVNRRTATIFGWIVGLFIAIWLLGFSVAVPIYTFLHLKIGAQEGWLISIIMTVVSWSIVYGLFDYILHVPFPQGWLFL